MCYPIQEIKHRNIDYFIFSRAVILHSLQVKFVCVRPVNIAKAVYNIKLYTAFV